MRFGIQFGLYPASTNPVEKLKNVTERAGLAARCNFEALFHGPHYLNGPDTAAFQSLPMAEKELLYRVPAEISRRSFREISRHVGRLLPEA